ncbi:hypothetical protein Aduo_001249 [Ancylostoma duodenale]
MYQAMVSHHYSKDCISRQSSIKVAAIMIFCQLKHKGQLYTVHGGTPQQCRSALPQQCRSAVAVYTTIIRQLKGEFSASMYPANLRAVLDFEEASINAAKRVFPGNTVQGCAFHSVQAWNRGRTAMNYELSGGLP